jgi:hypothetical protein
MDETGAVEVETRDSSASMEMRMRVAGGFVVRLAR